MLASSLAPGRACVFRSVLIFISVFILSDRSPSLGLRVYCVQVTGPSLTPAQSKFLEVLLRAPTLSYPGGLFMLQAFRGRSGKEVVARYVCTLGWMYDVACFFWEVLKASFFFPSTTSIVGLER